jgi:hypothetical protein
MYNLYVYIYIYIHTCMCIHIHTLSSLMSTMQTVAAHLPGIYQDIYIYIYIMQPLECIIYMYIYKYTYVHVYTYSYIITTDVYNANSRCSSARYISKHLYIYIMQPLECIIYVYIYKYTYVHVYTYSYIIPPNVYDANSRCSSARYL